MSADARSSLLFLENDMAIVVRNTTRDSVLGERCSLARSFWARGKGLLGRNRLDRGEGLIIYPEWSVHSFFMRFPIDIVFVSKDDVIVGMTAHMLPNRPFAGTWGARYVVELPAGTIAATASQVGDQLAVTPSPHQ